MSFRRLYLRKQQYICRFNLNYPIEKTYNAPFSYQFHSTEFKKSCLTTELRKSIPENTTILEQQNNKQKLPIKKALRIRNIQPKLNRINFETKVGQKVLGK